MKKTTTKVGARKYTVEIVAELREDGKQLLGLVDYSKGNIYIVNHMSKEHIMDTFLHEHLHAIAEERSVDLTEREVTQLASGLTAFIVDNPKLFGKTFEECF